MPSAFARAGALFISALVILTACGGESSIVSPQATPVAAKRVALPPGFYGECDPNTAIIECDSSGGGGGSGGNGPGTVVPGASWYACSIAPSVDNDQDGFDDNCEHSLALAFRPYLQVASNECGWDYQHDRLGGEYWYAVQRPYSASEGRWTRLAFLPAYYSDCGANGHSGDSELILLDVYHTAGEAWQVRYVFLSAHCGVTGGACGWYDANQFTMLYGAPLVWVARGKHANYTSYSACMNSLSNTAGFDYCDNGYVLRRVPLDGFSQNIGSQLHPFTPQRTPVFGQAPQVDPGRVERPWAMCSYMNNMQSCLFNGWQASYYGYGGGGSKSYGDHLDVYARFIFHGSGGGPPEGCSTDPNAFFC